MQNINESDRMVVWGMDMPGNQYNAETMKVKEVVPGLYEIDEYDCGSVFVICGEMEALVIDTGTGIGNLKEVVEEITDGRSYQVILSHAHIDHMGGAYHFPRILMNEKDYSQSVIEHNKDAAERRNYAAFIRQREKKIYPYDLEKDIAEWDKLPAFMRIRKFPFDIELGGRKITCLECPGHTAGSIVFLDHASRTLIVGDACNGYYILDNSQENSIRKAAETAYKALKNIDGLRDRFDRIINGHHDFREFGEPLDYQYLSDTMHGLEKIVQGEAVWSEEESAISRSGISCNCVFGSVKIAVID